MVLFIYIAICGGTQDTCKKFLIPLLLDIETIIYIIFYILSLGKKMYQVINFLKIFKFKTRLSGI